MLPKKNRLTKKKDFQVVFKEGKTIKDDFLIFKILKNNLKESRFGFVISKKVSTKAVVRNKIKRQLSNAVFNALKEVRSSSDIIIIVLSSVLRVDYLKIKEVISQILRKI